jgi:Endo-alpha-N-acetylgalactosaminidase/Galactose mutarotase-like fold domain
MRRRSFLGNIIYTPALAAGVGQVAEALDVQTDVPGAKDARVLRNDQMEVWLDSQFPRVFEYRIGGASRLEGAIATDRPAIELNGEVYAPADFTVTSQAQGGEVSYRLTFPKLALALSFSFRLDGNVLLIKLTRVDEKGSFRLNTLYFPEHFLIRMPALTPGGMMYRGEYRFWPWKEPVYRGGYSMSNPHFAAIAEEDGEEFPMRVNWAALYESKVCATIANNVGTWKLASQFLGFSARASDFALWNWTYHYRLRGKLQPLLESRVAVLTADGNEDGKVDWMEAAMWHRKLFPEPNRQYLGPTYIYNIINAWGPPYNNPVTSFEECLPIIKSIAGITGSLPQIVILVGWQYQGHDTGYPALDKVNLDVGGPEKLRWLAREAKKYNAVISYHINLDDAYREHPDWDPSVLCLGRDGKPYPWMFYSGGPGVHLQAYHISHTKEVESGYFQKRAQAFLEAVPVEKAVHCDTFRYSNISFGPGEDIGMNDELELGCKRIVEWFAARGIDVSSEGPYDGFYGMLSWFLHRQAMNDPFHIIMMHGKVYGGGKPLQPVNEVLGWSTDMPVQAHPSQRYKQYSVYSATETSDMFYLGTLLQYYLDKKELVFLGPEGDEYVARFSDGTISRQKNGGPLSVRQGDVVIADGQDRLIPLNDSELRLYSVTGGERSWTLPAAWSGAKTELFELVPEGAHEVKEFQIKNNRLKLTMVPRRPYVLRKR